MTAARKGWCPGALRPMRSGDGFVLRLRPALGRFTAEEALAICALSERYGNGILEVTRRANLQLRGVQPESHGPLLSALAGFGLVDPDEETERRRNVLVAPLWREGDTTATLALALERRLGALPDLPAKFGFAVDAGSAPVLGGAPADVRIERGRSGGLIVRPDGTPAGRSVAHDEAIDAALDLASWFVSTGGCATGRMARSVMPEQWTRAQEPPASAAPPLMPGSSLIGPVVGTPFGQTRAAALSRLLGDSGADAVRLTPWRLLVLEGAGPLATTDFITAPGEPLLRADACPGAPRCAAASVSTRPLARALAARLGGTLHVSGCAKGCARSLSADLTLVGRDGRFDLVPSGCAGDIPVETGLTAEAILSRYGCSYAPPV